MSGSSTMPISMVGTAEMRVIPWRSTRSSAAAASKRGSRTMVQAWRTQMFSTLVSPYTWKKGSTARTTSSGRIGMRAPETVVFM